ncbi:PepSY domain-containing protein [Agrococcus sp. SGAir0287]|uniref:PepSY domain-containing protein n=1 Tax=Agrococcus sp. SGAir0287 TaxID=2070347 RepID=UPI0010F72DF5|nr:PepSY domain-containing protein [Agrococcus sp. SGAir0287]
MNEQTPRDPQQPIDANDPTPQHPVAQPTGAEAPTAQQPVANPAAAEATPRRGRGILKPVLIGAGAAVAVLAVAGVGLTVADALDDANDQPTAQPSVTAPAPTTPSTGGPGADDDRGGDDQGGSDDGSGPAAPANPADLATASGLAGAIDAAVDAAGGQGATEVEVERDGWKVDVLLADGTEVEVRVFADGRESIVQQDDDDSRGSALIDVSRLSDIVDAALAATGGGTVDKIEAEDDDSHAYEVRVEIGGDQDVDVELADDLSVVSIDD